jgi:hypothetical protein
MKNFLKKCFIKREYTNKMIDGDLAKFIILIIFVIFLILKKVLRYNFCNDKLIKNETTA